MFSRIFYNFGKILCAIFFNTYLRMSVKGQENIPRKGGFLLAGNHVSYLDPIAFGLASPRPLGYMARNTLFRNPLFGWILKNVGVFPLKRNCADLGAIKEALRRLENGEGLLLFPEGTRSVNGQVASGLTGVAFLARKSRVPIVPAFVQGTDRAMPKGAKFIKPTKISVIIGRPFIFSSDKDISDQGMVEETMRRIVALKSELKAL